ncbi:MAG: hypothetical protein J6M47_02570 [Clostridia bacterium]|nr:hypothetical protein [Clostridia bacterium]
METMTLNFTSKERYGRAVRRLLMGDGQYQMVCFGKWIGHDTYFGYVEFKKRA